MRLVSLSFLLALPAVAGAEIKQFAVLSTGRVMEVASVERTGDRVRLALPEGAELVVPARLLVRIDREGRDDPAPAALPANDRAAAPPLDAAPYWDLLRDAATRHALDARLVAAVAEVESRFNPRAQSPKGALGLMQLMPDTARLMGVADPYDPAQNVDGGCRYLRHLLDRFDGDLALALAAYNAGPETVARSGGVPNIAETRLYVDRVLGALARL